MLNDMTKPRLLILYDAFYGGGIHMEHFSDCIISHTVTPGNTYDTSETPHFKGEQSSLIFPCQAPDFISIHHHRDYEGLKILSSSVYILSSTRYSASIYQRPAQPMKYGIQYLYGHLGQYFK